MPQVESGSSRRRRGGRISPVPTMAWARRATCVTLLGGVLAGCTSGEDAGAPAQPLSRDEWVTRTSQMLTNGLGSFGSAATLVLPAVEAGDMYTTSLALVAAGGDVGTLVDSVGRPLVAQRLRSATTDEALARSIAGPVSTTAVLLRADAGVKLLEDGNRQALGVVLDGALDRKPADVYEAAAAVTIATALDHRTGDAHTALTGLLQSSPVGCSGSESLFALGAAAEWLQQSAETGCSPEALSVLWNAEAAKAKASLEAPGATPGLGEAEAVLALARLTRLGPSSASQRDVVIALIHALDAAFVQGRVLDGIPVAANLATAAATISMHRDLPDQVRQYLREVVRGGGDANLLALDSTSVPLVHRTARAVGSTVRVAMPGGDATQRLAYHLSADFDPGKALNAADTATLSASIKAALTSASATDPAIIRGLALLGRNGCVVKGGVAAALAAAQVAPERVTTGDLTTRSLALRVLKTCDSDKAVASIRAPLLGHAQQVLERTAADKDRPTLVEAWQAASVACALDPKLLDDRDLWTLYQESASATGGAKDDLGAFVDLDATFMLATLTNPQHASCSISGVVG